MQPDFESVIERKIHAWFNYMEGVMHTGQRNQFRIRISKDAYDKGLRLTHFAEVLYHMITDEFEAVVDKCEVHLITDPVKATAFLNDVAMPRYNMRDDRLCLHDRRVCRPLLHLHPLPVVRAGALLRRHA